MQTGQKSWGTYINKNKVFKIKTVTRDKGNFVKLCRSVHQKDKITINVYISNNRASKYMKQN